ncbi:prepilin-type N-terminal cleavage/methylation domain-containing protein [Chloroflexota bacterium]
MQLFRVLRFINRCESGQTLMETLVALAILGITAVAFLNGVAATWAAPSNEGNYIIRVIVTDELGGVASKELAVVVTCDCGSR